MKILAVSGSVRADSYNTLLLRAALEAAPEGVELELWEGLGELPMDGPAPAVVNAVCRAMIHPTLNSIPLTPEQLMKQMNAKAPRRQE